MSCNLSVAVLEIPPLL